MYSLQTAAVPRQFVRLVNNPLYVTDGSKDRQTANSNNIQVQLLNPSEHIFSMPDEHGNIVYVNFDEKKNSEHAYYSLHSLATPIQFEVKFADIPLHVNEKNIDGPTLNSNQKLQSVIPSKHVYSMPKECELELEYPSYQVFF